MPADHFSAVSSTGDLRIAGRVRMIEMRRGRYLPLAGARFESADAKQNVGFKLVAKKPGRDLFDVVIYTNDGTGSKSATVGQVSLREPVSFELTVSSEGAVQLKVANEAFSAGTVMLARAKASVLCSTGQFKFEEVIF